MKLDTEEARLFDGEKILTNDMESMSNQVKLMTETPSVKDDEFVFIYHHFEKPKALTSKLPRCRCTVKVTIIAVLLLFVFSVFGILLVRHVFTLKSPSVKLKITENLKTNTTSYGQPTGSTALTLSYDISMRKFEKEFENSSVSFSTNKAHHNGTPITPSVTYRSSVSSFNCFSPWFTRLSSCYMFSNDLKTWNEALTSCKEKRGQLVKINDHAENMFVRLYARTFYHDFWIGLSYQSKERGWIWNHNATSVISQQYTNWASCLQKIKFRVGDCVELSKRSLFLWSVANCNEKKRYICEKHT